MTELVTNGTFDSDLSGWTPVTNSPTTPGVGGAGAIVFTAANGGAARFRTDTPSGSHFDGALKQDLGVLVAGESYIARFDTMFSNQGGATIPGASWAAYLWLQAGTAAPIVAVAVTTTTYSPSPGYPAPEIIIHAAPTGGTGVLAPVTYDLSHFITTTGPFTLWISGEVDNGVGSIVSVRADVLTVSIDHVVTQVPPSASVVRTLIVDLFDVATLIVDP